MNKSYSAVTLDCRALPIVGGMLRQAGVVVYEQTDSDQDAQDRMSGHETLVHFFLDAPLSAKRVAASGIRRVLVAGPAAGTVDEPALLATRCIGLFDTPGRTVRSVAEHTVCAVMALARSLPGISQAMQRGEWPREPGVEIRGESIGLIGFGAVAREVATMCGALGMAVKVAASAQRTQEILDVGCEPVPLETLLTECRFVSLHKRLSAETSGLLSARRMTLMRHDAYLINTARSELIDGDALLAALDAGRLAGAALDVFDVEPLPQQSAFRGHTKVICTPHGAWLTTKSMFNIVDSVSQFLSGQDNAMRRIY